jgi:hypothetical protein
LCIPYWEVPRFPGDRVDVGLLRPLPADVVSWECPGIHASPYLPGDQLQVTVDVRNSGGGSATVIATVVVYWADPTVGFVKPSFFGAASVVAPPMRDPMAPGFVSATVSGIIPASAPNHICLLAYVTHSLDQAKPVIDPFHDRHWAQRNLVAVSQKASPLIVPFNAANPFTTPGVFALHVRTLDRRALEHLAFRMRLEPSDVQARLRLLDGLGRPVTEGAGEARVQLTLDPQRRRAYSLTLDLDRRLAPHQVTAVEVVLHESREQRPVGSLGIVVTGSDTDV